MRESDDKTTRRQAFTRAHAIPTFWNGTQFRSRAEARWAFLFEAFGDIDWLYEAEGFQLKTHWYVPDFWFPKWQAFGEVKGVANQWTELALTKARELNEATGCPVLLLDEMSPFEFGCLSFSVEWPTCWVNIPQSARKGRLWYEWEPEFSRNWMPDGEWAQCVLAARSHRFD